MAVNTILAALSCVAMVTAIALPDQANTPGEVHPMVKGTPQVLGIITDPSLDRDSCGSTSFNTRALWVCRDTQETAQDGLPTFPVFSSSASWSKFNRDGTPALTPIDPSKNTSTIDVNKELLLYGKNHEKAFYPLQDDECNDNQAGECGDQTRYAIWPDSPPMVSVINADGSILAYTWIRKTHITADLGTLESDPVTSLYRVFYEPKTDKGSTLPGANIVREAFWGENEIPYGSYGNVVRNGTAYLYGQSSYGTIALAKVSTVGVEDITQYEYWVNGTWTTSMPSINETGIDLHNTAGGQGTFYFSEPWQAYVWIGGDRFPGASFFITTAPEPYGPWTEPTLFYQGVSGNYSLGAYSLQAHPALLPSPWSNEIYLTYTKNDIVENVNVYTHPLILVEWQ